MAQITPNLSLTVWNELSDPYDSSQLVDNFVKIDAHDHTLGSGGGVQVPNAGLVNSKITVGSTDISLGATSTTITGLTSVTSTAFTGALTGNATTATNLAAGTTTLASNVVNSSLVKIGALSAGTAGYVKTDASGNLSSSTTVTGADVSGNITGNAATATKLAATKTINGVAFDGSANITVSTVGAIPFAQIKRKSGATQSITTAAGGQYNWQLITFDLASQDNSSTFGYSSNMADIANERIYARDAGIYSVRFITTWSNTGTQARAIHVRAHAAPITSGITVATTSGSTSATLSGTYTRLIAGMKYSISTGGAGTGIPSGSNITFIYWGDAAIILSSSTGVTTQSGATANIGSVEASTYDVVAEGLISADNDFNNSDPRQTVSGICYLPVGGYVDAYATSSGAGLTISYSSLELVRVGSVT
jgi:hypothetical protein